MAKNIFEQLAEEEDEIEQPASSGANVFKELAAEEISPSVPLAPAGPNVFKDLAGEDAPAPNAFQDLALDDGKDDRSVFDQAKKVTGLVASLLKQQVPLTDSAALLKKSDQAVDSAAPQEKAPGRAALQEMVTKGLPLPLAPLAASETGKEMIAGAASGGAGTMSGMSSAVPAAEAWLGIDTPVGRAAQKSADFFTRLAQDVGSSDPSFKEQLASGAGSMALFMVPGAGTATLAAQIPRFGVLAARLAPAIATGVSTVLESATEAGGVFEAEVQKGINRKEASKAAFKDFIGNVALVGLTNRFGIGSEEVDLFKKFIKSAPLESIQEFGQSLLEDVSKGEEIDWKKAFESGAVGAVVGGGAGVVAAAAQGPVKITEDLVGPKAAQYLDTKFPNFADAIAEKEVNLTPEQIKEGLIEAATAGEKVILEGGTPEQAEAAVLETFAQISEGAAQPEVEQVPAQGEAQAQAPAKATMDEILERFDPDSGFDAIEPEVQVNPTKKVRITRKMIEQEARDLYEDAKEERETRMTELERFIVENGGIAAYKENPDTGQREEMEEYRSVPVRLRGTTPYDVMMDRAIEAHILPPDAAYGDLYEKVANLPKRGRVPRIADFYQEAKRNLEYRIYDEAQRQGELAEENQPRYSAMRSVALQKDARSAALDVLRKNRIDDRVVVQLVDAIQVDDQAFQAGYGQSYDPARFEIRGETVPTQQILGEGRARLGAVINLARSADVSTGRHEAFHAVTNLLLTESEQAAVLKKYGDMETAADAFGDFQKGTKTGETLIDRIFRKIAEFMERFVNFLDQKGFRTADDVFRAIDQGELKERSRLADESRRPRYSAKEQQELDFSGEQTPYEKDAPKEGPIPDPQGAAPSTEPAVRGPRLVHESHIALQFREVGHVFIPNQKIKSPADIAFAFRALKDETVENFLLGAVKNGRIVGIELLGTGTIDQIPVFPFETFNLLDAKEADSFFLVHNHPSGATEPSEADKRLTHHLQKILFRQNRRLIGHIVIDTEKFGFIDPDGSVEQFAHKDYKRTKKIPVLHKYVEWKRSKDSILSAPPLSSPQAVFELAKGIQTGKDESVVFLLNTQNAVLNAAIVPNNHLNSSALQALAMRNRANALIVATEHQLSNAKALRQDLKEIDVRFLDVVEIAEGRTRYQSQAESGRLRDVAQYSAKNRTEFIGWQDDGEGGGIALYNTPAKSGGVDTVDVEELKARGIPIPETPTLEEWKKQKAKKINAPAFKKWFEGSKVVEADGSPKIMYHSTTAPDQIREFERRGGLAGHFGTIKAAEDRMRQAREDGTFNENEPASIVPVYLSIKNPVEMTDVHFDNAFEMLEDLRVRKILDFKDAKKINAPSIWPDSTRKRGENTEAMERLVTALKRKGYDGIVYKNKVEDPGSETYIAFEPTQIKSAISNRGTFDAKDARIQYSAKPKAPTFYSNLERVLDKKLPARAMPQQVKNILNSQDVKREEVEWSGLEEWLEEQKGSVTKEQVLDVLKANQVQVKEVVKGGATDQGFRIFNFGGDPIGGWFATREEAQQEIDRIKEMAPDDGADTDFRIIGGQPGTKFSKYALPGGENYRELLLTLPIKGSSQQVASAEDAGFLEADGDPVAADIAKQKAGQPVFTSSHFSEPNILAHVRFNERTDANGDKVLFIEEIQSDWHQIGREKGYRSDSTEDFSQHFFEADKVQEDEHQYFIESKGRRFAVGKGVVSKDGAPEYLRQLILEENAAIAAEQRESSSRVPDAPFKKTWHELALKRMLRWAAENGFDKIAWTTGEQQAERYDLSKHIDSLGWWKTPEGTYGILAKKDGKMVTKTTEIPPRTLDQHVGKELAKKIIDGEGQSEEASRTYGPKVAGNLSGLDLKVGGEGMKGFYDQIIPSFLNKYTKKWGGRVEKTEISTTPAGGEIRIEQGEGGIWAVTDNASRLNDDPPLAEFKTEQEARAYAKTLGGPEQVHALDITPEMKQSILAEGQPLYSAKIRPSDDSFDDKTPAEVYEQNRMIQGQRDLGIKRDMKDVLRSIGETADQYLGILSTRLKNIDPTLKYALRSFEFKVRQRIKEDLEAVKPLLEKGRKMSPADQADFDLARKNGDLARLQHLTIKYEMVEDYFRARKILNSIHLRAREVGFDVGYREHYFPRIIRDSKGLLEFFQKREDWTLIQDAIASKETALGRALSDDEKAALINTMIRGYQQGKISLSETGNMKTRLIDIIDAELNTYYYPSDESLIRYLRQVNERIEARRFFGKGNKELEFNDVEGSIGAYVLDLLAKGKIKPAHEKELKDLLTARFAEEGPNALVGFYRDLAYMDTMGSISSAITQLQDLAFSLYKAPAQAMPAFGRAITGRSIITRNDLGLENIAQEFENPRTTMKAVQAVFKLSGLTILDGLGKETLINAVITKYQKMAKLPTKTFTTYLESIFEEETPAVLDDLRNGVMSENVKLLAFNEIADVQPVALSEMPEKYLTSGNGRIFYMLKTFTLKQIDIYRNEVFQLINSGDKAQQIKGVRNLFALTVALMLTGATADEIKDVLFNRETSLTDRLVDNILKIMGFTKFTIYKARQEGIGSAAVRLILPPFKFLDALYKDIVSAGDGKGLEVAASVPVGGKLYYWWFGKGAKKTEEKRKRIAKKERLERRKQMGRMVSRQVA